MLSSVAFSGAAKCSSEEYGSVTSTHAGALKDWLQHSQARNCPQACQKQRSRLYEFLGSHPFYLLGYNTLCAFFFPGIWDVSAKQVSAGEHEHQQSAQGPHVIGQQVQGSRTHMAQEELCACILAGGSGPGFSCNPADCFMSTAMWQALSLP